MASRCSSALFALVVLLLSSSALAQRSVAITSLGRGGARSVERAIERELGERGHAVVRVERSAQTDADAAAIAAEAGVELVIGGRASAYGSRRRRRVRAAIWVRDASGAVQSSVDVRVRPGAISRIARRVASVIDGTVSAESEPAPEPREVGDTAPREPARRRVPARSTPASPPLARALVQVGGGMRTRVIELLAPDGLDAAYRAEPYFELTARAEARFFDVAFVRARFGSSVGLTSEREDPSLGTVATSFYWMRGDVGASAILDDTVELGGAFGVGWDRYELAFNELVPTVEYVHLRPSIIASVRLVGRALMLDGEAGLRIPFGVGDLESLHGRNHEVIGADVLARLHGVIDPGFAWAIEAGARRYWLTFTRPDGVVSGTDAGWHLTAWAGWELR